VDEYTVGSSIVTHNQVDPSLSRNGKVDFSELAHVVASNWRGLAPEEKIPYGKLAAFQQRQMEEYYKQPTTSYPSWNKDHVKVQDAITLPAHPANHHNKSSVWVEIETDVEDDVVLEEVVEDVMAEIEAGFSNSIIAPEDKEEHNPPPTLWPLLGESTPIADYIRCCRYPQHALQHTHTCMPCITTTTATTTAATSTVTDDDMLATTAKTTYHHRHHHHHHRHRVHEWKCSQSDVVLLSQSLEAEGRDFCLQALLGDGDDGDDDGDSDSDERIPMQLV